MRSVPGLTACVHSRLPIQTEPFFLRYSRKEECVPALNQIPSYLLLEIERDHRGQLSQLSGSAGRHTDRVNPHGSRLVLGLTGNRVNDCPALSPLWSSDRTIDKTCREGQQHSLAFPASFLIWTLMSPQGNRRCGHNSSWHDTFCICFPIAVPLCMSMVFPWGTALSDRPGETKWSCGIRRERIMK